MPIALDRSVSVPVTFSPNTLAASAQVNANHTDHATVAETLASGPNLIIGGDFTTNPWQRGTTFTAIANGAYAADRWRVDYVTSAVVDVLKAADAPTVAQAGYYSAHSLHLDVTTADAAIAATDLFTVGQRVEGLHAAFLGFGQASARSIALSFWVKSPKTGTHCVAVRNSAVDRSYVAEYTVSAADTWERKTVVIPGDTSGTWLATNGIGINITWALAAGADFQTTAGAWAAGNFVGTSNQVNCLDNTANNFKLALVQLEDGDIAGPFKARRFADELELCRRYFQKSFLLATAPAQNAGIGTGETKWHSTLAGAVGIVAPATRLVPAMRAAPTITLYNPAAANALARNYTDTADCGATSGDNISETSFYIATTGNAGLTVGDTLAAHWSASAEL